MSDTKFAIEKVMDVADELKPLLDDHYEEAALHKDVVKLDPDWALYVALEERGDLVMFTIREDGTLVGYGVFFLSWHAHYRQLRCADNDIIFLEPRLRKTMTAGLFIAYCEAELKRLGAQKLTFRVKTHIDWSPMLFRKGYDQEEIVMGKIL